MTATAAGLRSSSSAEPLPTARSIGGTTQAAKLLGAEGFTAVDYDRRGRGRSGDTPRWSLDREVEDVTALIKAVGGAAALCTNSSGADIALAAAARGSELPRLSCLSRRSSPA